MMVLPNILLIAQVGKVGREGGCQHNSDAYDCCTPGVIPFRWPCSKWKTNFSLLCTDIYCQNLTEAGWGTLQNVPPNNGEF